MPYTYTNKTIKFIRKLRHFSNYLERLKLLTVHQHIDQFYYMQKTEELKLLHQQLIEALTIADTIQFRLEGNYRKVYHQWRMDARWLNQHLSVERIKLQRVAAIYSKAEYGINSVATNYRCNESS